MMDFFWEGFFCLVALVRPSGRSSEAGAVFRRWWRGGIFFPLCHSYTSALLPQSRLSNREVSSRGKNGEKCLPRIVEWNFDFFFLLSLFLWTYDWFQCRWPYPSTCITWRANWNSATDNWRLWWDFLCCDEAFFIFGHPPLYLPQLVDNASFGIGSQKNFFGGKTKKELATFFAHTHKVFFHQDKLRWGQIMSGNKMWEVEQQHGVCKTLRHLNAWCLHVVCTTKHRDWLGIKRSSKKKRGFQVFRVISMPWEKKRRGNNNDLRRPKKVWQQVGKCSRDSAGHGNLPRTLQQNFLSPQ